MGYGVASYPLERYMEIITIIRLCGALRGICRLEITTIITLTRALRGTFREIGILSAALRGTWRLVSYLQL